ncbi:MAG: hypothetical protein Q7T74_06160 [Candidatus Saccharibacteria bacterium]|nr:hypothetical protein [Candidatus Saccharibacteria bacterium]
MNDPTHFFIDFDETLFDYRAYVDWVDGQLSTEHGMPAGNFVGTMDEFHDTMDDSGLLRLRMYRHRDHVKHATGHDWPVLKSEIELLLGQSGQHFCYPDSHEFVIAALQAGFKQVRLLTYGSDEYQRYKISLCPIMKGLLVDVVDRPKADFLAANFGDPSIQGILVDDKAPLGLPENWQHVWLNRTGKRRPKNANCIEVRELNLAKILQAVTAS